MQRCKVKDRAGRTVSFMVQRNNCYKTWESHVSVSERSKSIPMCRLPHPPSSHSFETYPRQMRQMWYAILSSLDDEEAQKKGVVLVFYNVGLCAPEKDYSELMRHMHMVSEALPYRAAANHYCYDDVRIRAAMALLQLILGKNHRLRFRSHFGTRPNKKRGKKYCRSLFTFVLNSICFLSLLLRLSY